MENDFRIQIRFWGVRGSIPTPEVENLGYGGNTTCIEVRTPGNVLVIDAGSGIRNLGMSLQREFAGKPCSLHLLLTHFHMDHIQGLPFFSPLFSPSSEIAFHASRTPEEIRANLEVPLSKPYFPGSLDLLAARKTYVGESSDSFRQGGLTVRSFPLNHPQGASGYRFEANGAVIVHASDHEHGDRELDRVLREHAQNADVLVIDAQYTPEEYESKRGWGHGTWLEATQIANECNVKQLVLFHHDPTHNDAFIDDVVFRAKQHFENTVAAKEGWATGA